LVFESYCGWGGAGSLRLVAPDENELEEFEERERERERTYS
jgi:hypothetical protein